MVTNKRTKVRMIASVINQAWCANKVIANKTCPVANSSFSAKLRNAGSQRLVCSSTTALSSSASNAGIASAVTTSASHTNCGERGNAQDKTSTSSAAGAESVRRKLSNIFQRPIAVISRPRDPNIQGRSCQSPRAQRCCRAAATSTWDGKSSNTSTSLTNAQRAKLPSNRS